MSTTTYPEHDKLAEVSDNSQAIGEFLDEGSYVLAEWKTFDDDDSGPQLVPVSEPIERILAKHFGIDLNKLENEKREILARLADLND